MLQIMVIVAAVASATSVVLGLIVRNSARRRSELEGIVRSQAEAVRVAQRAADEAMRVMTEAKRKADAIREERDARLGVLEAERVKLLMAAADPKKMAEVWNDVFSG